MAASWKDSYRRKRVSSKDAAKQVKDNDFICVGLGIGACSPDIYHTILARWNELKGVRIKEALMVRPAKLYAPSFLELIEADRVVCVLPIYKFPKIIDSNLYRWWIKRITDIQHKVTGLIGYMIGTEMK
jgi:hypothetical protein